MFSIRFAVGSRRLKGHVNRGRGMPDFRVQYSEDTANLPEVVELLADAWADAANIPKGQRILESATAGQRLLLGYHLYWDDVINGGHWQFFENYTGNLWQEALEATHVLRLPEEAILRDAVDLFPGKRPGLTQRERRPQLAKISRAKLDQLDDRFGALRGSDRKIKRYVTGHPDEFFLPKRGR
ncbi:MAG: DUF4375 domain-containing protein [Gemmataceae bacterium]